MKDFKYKATFNADASFEKKSYKSFQTSASVEDLKDLKQLLPGDEYMREHDDLLFCSFNLAVAGLINKNNHGILPSTAEKMMKYWVNRPLNIEHDRANTVGVIINTGFSTFGDNKIIEVKDALAAQSPFNLAMAGVVWKVVDPYFADYLEYSNKYSEKDNYLYGKISTSWEVGYSDFVIARGSKNLFNAEIISDKAEIEKNKKYLTQFGGNGFDDKNTEVYLVISGDARPLGGGFTENPAAAVKSVFIPDIPDEDEEEDDPEDENEEEEEDSQKKENCSEIKSEEKAKENENKISHNIKITVKKINDMKFKDINDFVDKYSEAVAKQEVFASSDVREFIQNSFLNEAEKWKSQIDEKEKLIESANSKVKDLEVSLNETKADAEKTSGELESLRKELGEIREKAVKAENEAVFNKRMADLDSKYELNEKTRKKIVKDTFGLSDEDYASWVSDEGEVILAGKEKTAKTPEEALKEAKASEGFVPNAADKKDEENKFPSLVKTKRNGNSLSVSFE